MRFLLGYAAPRGPGAYRALLFFLCIGAGYILVQVALIQKFVLFLGHPTYALTVVIFSMLIASGLGSLASKRIVRSDFLRLAKALAAVVAAVLSLAAVVTPIAESGVALPFPAKVLITVALIGPAAFFMGMPFPTALSLLEARVPVAVRWAWAVNAASSVLGSAAAIFLAIYIGLKLTLVMGAVLYVAAWLSGARSPLNARLRP